MADFSNEQIKEYATLWFRSVGKSHVTFVEELSKPENVDVQEICNSPLLLSMVCLYFEQVMCLPPSHAELYEDAIEALLTKWDASREIVRDEISHGVMLYRELSPRRKKQMFAEIAARTIEAEEYFFRRRDLAKWIDSYLATLPNVVSNDIDSNAVLRAIEAQHGIFVEQAKDVYSFSHLTFQEYFAACYIFDHERRGTTIHLLEKHITDNRWRSIFLLTISLLDRAGADDFFVDMYRTIANRISDKQLQLLLIWADIYAIKVNPPEAKRNLARLAYVFLMLALALKRTPIPDLDIALAITLDFASALACKIGGNLEIASASVPSLDFACTQINNLAYTVSIQVGVDYGLYYAWSYAELLAQYWWPHDDNKVYYDM